MSKRSIKVHIPDEAEDREIDAGIAADSDTFVPDDGTWRQARRRGRPPVDAPKVRVSIRLSQSVIEAFKAGGKGWQGRIDETLKSVVEGKRRA